METPTSIVISASRRTDIPAFYMDWFMEQLNAGAFKIINPYNQRVSEVPATPDKIHSIVFWSKDFGTFIQGGFHKKLKEKGFNLFFNFTINSETSILEPHVSSLPKRLDQLEYLSHCFDPRSIHWRFDPICFFTDKSGKHMDNLNDFQRICDKASVLGIQRCVTSFMDMYPKIKTRLKALPNVSFIEPSIEKKISTLLNMEKILLNHNIQLLTCCEKEVLSLLPETTTIRKNACIPNDILMELYGGNISLKTDKGQRIKKGCGCMASVDIGSYRIHPCYHNCLFCYANPCSSDKQRIENNR